MHLTRRDLLDVTLRAAALPGAAAFFSAWLSAAQTAHHPPSSKLATVAPPEPPLLRNYTPKFFDAGDFEALQSFTEILIPTDDTPGAKEAHCAHFIDFVVHSAAEGAPEMQKQWRSAMSSLRDAGFHAADVKGRETLMAAISRPEKDRTATHAAYTAYRLIKQQTAFAFYTSRAGMIENLDYRGNTYNESFPACEHPEHHRV